MTYNYCSQCGGVVDKTGAFQYTCRVCDRNLYSNSVPTASALIVDRHRVLLGKRTIEPSKGMWDIPGGFCDFGEHPEETVQREVLEETGLIVSPKELLGIYMDEYGPEKISTLNIAYIVTVTGGQEKANDDLEELKWFSVDQIPADIAFENGRRMLHALKDYLRLKK